MNQTTKLPEIRKEAFTKARESLGLSTQELSGKACLSVRQIEQIENGQSSSFYGPQIKVTAAKKVAAILNLKEEDAFEFAQVAPIKKMEAAPLEPAKKVERPSLESIVKKEAQALPKQDSANTPKNTKKKMYFLVGIAAALVFSIINLRPLFFPEVGKEEVVVIEEAAPSAPAEVVADAKTAAPTPEATPAAVPVPQSTPATQAAISTECPAADTAAVTYKPDAPKKAGDMVYMQSKTAQTVCVVDASGKTQNKALETGVGVSVYGKPPFKVFTTGINPVDLYYQGAKVRLSNITSKTINLEPAEVVQPLTSTDSQLR